MKLLTGVCVALLLTLSAVCQAQTTKDNLPEGIVALVEVANPHAAWQDLQRSATAVMQTAKLPPLDALVGKMMGAQGPSALDLDKSIQLAFPGDSLSGGSPVVLVFHVTDVQAFLDSVKFKPLKPTAGDGLAIYTGTAGQVAVGSVGKRVVLGRGQEGDKGAAEVFALLKAGKWPEEAIGGEDDVAVAARPAALLKALSAGGESPFAAVKRAMQRSMQMSGAQSPQAMQELLGAEIDIVEGVLRQLDTVVFTAAFGADEVVLKNRTGVVAGGTLSAYLAGLPSGKLTLQRFMPADSTGVAIGKVGDVSVLLKGYDEFTRKVLQATGAGQDEQEAVLKMAHGIVDDTGHEIAEAALLKADGTMCVVYAVQTTDPAAMQKQLDAAPALLNKLPGGLPGWPKVTVKASPEPVVYKDQKITEWSCSFKYGAQPGMPNAEMAAQMQQRMMEMMFGSPFNVYATFVGKTWLLAYGPGALDALKAVIDGKGTLEGSKRLEAVGAPGEQDVLGYVSLTDMASWYAHLLATAFASMPMPIDFGSIRFPEAPDAGFSARMAGKNLAEAQLRVPTAAVKSLVQGAMTAYMRASASSRATPGKAGIHSKEPASQSSLHQIGLAIQMWRADHDQRWPSDLAAVATDYIRDPAKVLVDPSDPTPQPLGSSGLKTSYEYIGGLPAMPPFDAIIAYSRKGVLPDGRYVLLVDNSVVYITEAQLHGQAPGARITLQQSYNAVVAAYGNKLTPQDKARLQRFYEVGAGQGMHAPAAPSVSPAPAAGGTR